MFFPKTLFIFALFAHSAIGKHWPPALAEEWIRICKPYRDECILKTNADPSEIAKMLSEAYVANNDAIHNYLTCLYEKLHLFEPNGEISEKVVMETATYMTAVVTKKCVRQASLEETRPKRSYILAKCIVDTFAIL
ncbi:hypothetical protein FQR65_LT09857 [Abscondita terminalis]|nr:hypothetical protein FQR65_LT09857 [Abscondita terminalis]